MTSGPVLFARYAYPPNALGYCGPDDARALLEYADAQTTDAGLVDLARRFSGAWPYLSLIAAGCGRSDPLDAAVVDAYWIGNPLLERVPPQLLVADLEDRFRHQLGAVAFADVAQLAGSGGRAHHNFHVFAVYPWVGMLRAGHTQEPLRVIDSCRVRWGLVESIDGDQATLVSRPLLWTGRALTLGPARPERARLRLDGYGLAPDVTPGQWVSAHWDWVCDVLDQRQRRDLAAYTASQLAVVNTALDRPVAGVLLG
jgi:hypothetical protein